jgi:hypothetical protein
MAKTKTTPRHGEPFGEPTRERAADETIPLPPTEPLPFPVDDPPLPPDVPYLVEDDDDVIEAGADDINGDDEDKDDGDTREGADEETA